MDYYNELVKKYKLSNHEINQLINEKIEEFSGLIDEEGAIIIVHHEIKRKRENNMSIYDEIEEDNTPLEGYGDVENPFAERFAEQSKIHKFINPEKFGFLFKEVKESKKNLDIYFRGFAYYPTGRKYETVFPFSSMLTQLKKKLGYKKEDVVGVEELEKLIGMQIWINYSGKKDSLTGGSAYHSCYIEFVN